MDFSVIIATSQKRTDWLINRSLLSVYNQEGINKSEWRVIIVDDNEDSTEFVKIPKQINFLRDRLNLDSNDFPTTVIKNRRTQFMSGTGAWNTGVFEANNISPNGFVSILDDDDEYLPTHLSDCVSAIKTDSIAVFQRLIWYNDDKSSMNIDLTKESLTAENFFIGNPGVQGSNMFFKSQSFVEIGGFNEALPNTTDRDLMIRFLWKNDLSKIEVIEKIGVNHFNHKRQKVNNDISRKQQGLDLFYKKYKAYFSEEAYQKSRVRAKKYFNYTPKEQIIICMPLKNAENTVKKAILSLLNQTNTKREIVLLIGNDKSTDNSEKIINEIASQNSNIVLLNVSFGKAYLNRNYLNEYARKNYPNCILIGRLDADDVIYNDRTISQIEKLYDETNFDVLMCGNKQVKNGEVLEWENKPSKKLLQKEYLLSQLFKMTERNPKAELPSCNTFIKPFVKTEYPDKLSAEDHWFTVLLLLQKEKLNIQIDESLIYCYYSLDGIVTHNNKKNMNYKKGREDLFHFFIEQQKEKWESYIVNDGMSFHLENIKTYKNRLKSYWDLNYPVNERISNELKNFTKNKIRLLDACCGPFPKSGVQHSSFTIERTLVDTLADEYHYLLKENSICCNGQTIIKSNIEEILEVLGDRSFDIIYSKNALDHTYNPILSIKNLVKLLADDGIIILEHYIKEGEYTDNKGLHQWDFYINDGDFYISNKGKDIVQNINKLFDSVQIESFYEENKIINIIRENG